MSNLAAGIYGYAFDHPIRPKGMTDTALVHLISLSTTPFNVNGNASVPECLSYSPQLTLEVPLTAF
ncbi:MAG: hypothetical protein ACTHKM_12045 [Tsuneonella sp.]